jgi:hypothetical protein
MKAASQQSGGGRGGGRYPARRRRWWDRFPKTAGFILTMAMHVVFVVGPSVVWHVLARWGVPVAYRFGRILEWSGFKHEAAPLLVGIVQIPYVVVAMLVLIAVGRGRIAVGVLIGAVFTFLLNAAACVALLGLLAKATHG